MTLRIKQMLKFFVVGGIGVFINYITYKAFLMINIPNDYAWLGGILLSSFSNYILNAKWTFKKESE